MTSFTVTKSPKSESETRKVKVGYYSPLSKRVETKMTIKTILDPPDFALLFSSTAPKSLHTEAVVRGNFISTAGALLVTTVYGVSVPPSTPLQSPNCLLSTSTAHSN